MHPEAKYNTIGAGYNVHRQADPYLVSRIVSLLQGKRNAHYLDIGCGTGNYTRALARQQLHFTGVDPSERMLAIAREQSDNVQWLTGTAEHIPLSDAQMDGIIATLTIHHWSDHQKAFGELYRVLRPGGRIVLFTSAPEQMDGYWLRHYFPQMLRDSATQMPAPKNIQQVAESNGLRMIGTEIYTVREDLKDGFLYIGKNHPERYFDESIRRGISSFSALSNREEVTHGLAQLRKDLDSGRFETIRRNYENSGGDYLFMIFEKELK